MYIGYFVQWLSDALEAVGNAVKSVFHEITHNPVWGGATLVLVVVVVWLFVMKKKSAG